jgi:pimeloyl-ACP methyl ester carboxylesterase
VNAAVSFQVESGPNRLAGTEVGDGPAVVLLHAGGERRSVWDPIAARLAVAGYRCLSIDQRGHGASGEVGADRLDGFVTDALALIETTGGPVVLVGASLGGFVALAAAATSPADVAGLVLIDVVPAPDPTRVRAHLAEALPPERTHSALVEHILGRADDLRAAASSLRLPTLLVTGARSPAIGRDETRQMLELVPFADIVTIPGAGHLVARDQPSALAATLETFLSHPAVRHRHLNTPTQDHDHPSEREVGFVQ